MPRDSRILRISRPLPGTRWLALLLPVGLALLWLAEGRAGWAAGAALLAAGALAVGDKAEVDAARRRYRAGRHWAHLLNPPWQPLPPVRGVLVKPRVLRTVTDSKYGWQRSGGGREVFVVLLSVPGSARGVVLASVPGAGRADAIAAAVAGALGVPWQRA